MEAALSRPLPGESLLSVVSRYLDDLGVLTVSSTISNLFGTHDMHLQGILPGGLRHLSEVTQTYWSMVSDQYPTRS
jgi:Ni,Fe-hydrogenase I large subunit